MANLPADPEVIPWKRFQKEAGRFMDVSVYITSMNAHILNQRDELKRQTTLRQQAEYERDHAIEDVARLHAVLTGISSCASCAACQAVAASALDVGGQRG